MAMVRYQMFIDEGQKRTLEEMHQRLHVPVAELVRRAISRFVDDQQSQAVYATPDEHLNGLLSLAGVCEGGPADLADAHDHYLSGEKKP